jgi:putative ATP-dependent endonuclease of the OLD family
MACSFFAKNILLVEGATEKCFLDYLIENNIISLKIDQYYILDCMGKFNIPRFMNLFNSLGINHYVLYDKDTGHKLEEVHKKINSFIKSSSGNYTKKIDSIDPDIERFFGTPIPNREYKKPLFIIYEYLKNTAKYSTKVTELETKINSLFI